MRKALLTTFLILIAASGFGQYTQQDNASTKRQFRGMIEALQGFRLPVQGGHSIPAGDSLWHMRLNPTDGQLYMWNGLSWGCMTCGGSGIVDSNLFVTLSRLRDSLYRVQSTLDDSTMVLRGLIAGGSADSALFATLYRLDTTRAGLDMRISAKQNQLNGTGFVKVSGTTVTYDNSTYVPASRTITINGTSQDLSANRSWTISSSADSSTFATNYRVDTAKANIRTSLNGKLSTSDTATMLGGYLRKGDTASISNRINSKQNLITLTTTGTSGAATFNQSTGALNIPNYANTTYTGSTSIILTSGSFQRAALTGDVTATQNSNSTTIANSAVTNAKMANMATQTFKGRNTAGSGAPEDINMTTARTMLSINNVDNTSDLNKPISTATQAALDLKIDSLRTSVDSIYVKVNGGWYFAGVISAQGAGVSWGSIGGTLSAQTDLQNALNAKLNVSDTATMLGTYLRKADTASMSTRINARVAYVDTATMLNPYLRKGDTTALLAPYLRKADTANMLSSYTRVQRFLDSISAVRSFAGTKQNQLNGTGFVKASGTTISYDNTTYVPTNRTITINGTSQDLSANRSWTISTSADSSIFETRYRADTAKANMRLSLANKLENITGLIQQGTNVTITGNGTAGSPYVISASGGGGGGGLDTAAVSAIVADSLSDVIRQGGNSFGVPVEIGSNDNFPLNFMINNETRFRATNWFTNYGLLHPSQNTGIVFVNNSLRFPSSGDFIFYPSGSASTNVMRYTTSGLAIGYGDGTNASAKLDVNGSALINGGTLEVKGNSASTGHGLLVENSSGEDIIKANNDRTIQIEGYSGSDTALIAVDASGNLLRKGINTLPFLSVTDTTGKWLSTGTVVTNWSGASTGLNAATGRTSLGGTTVGQSFFTLTNPSAITFPRINANNTVSALSASDFRTAIGAGTGNGTVTSVGVSVPTGFSVSGSPITTSGTITLSYATGYQGYTSSEASKLSGIEAGADVTDATNVAAAGAIMDGDFSTNGIMVRTAAGSYTSRTVTGTANQISVSNGDGVSGNPTLSLHSDVTTALGKANTSLQPSDTVSVLFTKSDALIIRKYVDNCTSCTLTVNDHRTILRIANASPVTLYVPTGLQDDFEVLIEQAGAGKITVSALSGVAIGSFESAFTTKGTYATATLYATEEEDEFTLTGNLE